MRATFPLLVLLVVPFTHALLPYCGYIPGTPPPPLIPSLPSTDPLSPGSSLRQVQVAIRHGDRTQASATSCWPADQAEYDCTLTHMSVPGIPPELSSWVVPRLYRKVYMSKQYEIVPGNCGVGQLTQRGYVQQVTHGRQLREAYVNRTGLLPHDLDQSVMYVRSDDVPRTLQSAEALLLGLYPVPAQGTTRARIVNIFTTEVQRAIMFPNSALCPGLADLEQQLHESDAYRRYMNETVAPLAKKVAAVLNVSEAAVTQQVPDCLWVHQCHQQPIPDGMTPELLELVAQVHTNLSIMAYAYPSRTVNARYSIGPLLYNIFSKLEASINNATQHRFVLWSGHDSTLMPLLSAFDALDAWSPYAALVALELYDAPAATSGLAVRLMYNGKVLSVPGCSSGSQLCDFAQFASYMKTVLPTAEECPNYPLD